MPGIHQQLRLHPFVRGHMININNMLFISLGGVLGYFVRVLVEHYLAKSRTREDRKEVQHQNAVNAFRQTLITELSGLYPEFTIAVNTVGPQLAKAIPKIQIAVSLFSFTLDDQNAKELQEAFNSLRVAAQDEIPHLCSPAERMYGQGTVFQAMAILRERVDQILSQSV